MPLSTALEVRVGVSHTSALDLSVVSDPVNYLKRMVLSDGTGSGQADRICHDQRTLAPSGTENLDLAGSLIDAFGGTATFARIKAVIVGASASNTNDVQVTREGINGVPLFLALGDGLAVRPGGIFVWAASDATAVVVTAATADLLTFTNSGAGTGVTYDVIIIGASA